MKTPIFSAIMLALAALCLSLPAHETEEKSPYPGFRPECERAPAFIADVKTATVRVYPSVIRTPTNTTYSAASQQQVVAFLNEEKITRAVADDIPVEVGEIQGRGQFDWFQNDMATIGQEVESRGVDADYVLVMEVLFPPQRGSRQSVFGIHCIVLNTEGQNAFSFLLNSHHQMFVDAKMTGEGESDQVRNELIKKATAVGLEALAAQIQPQTMQN